MKRKTLLIISLISLIALSGCGKSQDSKSIQSTSMKTVEEVLSEQISDKQPTITNDTQEKTSEEKAVVEKNIKIDVDLTSLSSTMIYSEVYNIMQNPQEYIGKTIKMNGTFVKYTNQDGTSFYPACVIADAAACCSQGIEFVTTDNKYPDEGNNIIVIGIFNSYIDEFDGQIYFHLEKATLL